MKNFFGDSYILEIEYEIWFFKDLTVWWKSELCAHKTYWNTINNETNKYISLKKEETWPTDLWAFEKGWLKKTSH
jgi:hypothetical protein